VLRVTFHGHDALAGLIAIPLTLLARFVAVGLPVTLLRTRREFTRHAVKVMTWGGLRGGISVALALSLREGMVGRGGAGESSYQLILTMTYVVVVFSILVQGLTVGPLMRRLGLSDPVSAHASGH
jgi:CPA1 family monovalent cation:H+ antiporter